MNTTWDQIEQDRMRREDESVARKWAPWKHLGRGHMHPELCRGASFDSDRVYND